MRVKKCLCLLVVVVVVTLVNPVGAGSDYHLNHNLSLMYANTAFTFNNALQFGLSYGLGGNGSRDFSSSDLTGGPKDVYLDYQQREANHRDQFNGNYEADAMRTTLGINTQNDRLLWHSSIYYDDVEGQGNYTNFDTQTTGITIMPGYQVLTQADSGVTVNVFVSLDINYREFSQNFLSNQWRINPGIAASASRQTDYGLFQAAYTYNYDRNIDGDTEVSGKAKIAGQAVGVNYARDITENVYAMVGLTYMTTDDAPAGMTDEMTDVSVGVGTKPAKQWRVNGRYVDTISGGDGNSFNINIGYLW
jgi:hypothetical protein